MLEKIPAALGRALHEVRAGVDGLTAHDAAFGYVPQTLQLASPDFASMGPLPRSCTADGEGLSPALAWTNVPAEARALVLIVEDEDSPTPVPLVHALAFDLLPEAGGVAAGELSGRTGAPHVHVGLSSSLHAGWLPPDPPAGHGTHRYHFQLFALNTPITLPAEPGRAALVTAMLGHVIARGEIVGCYERP
jgi:hypothetical protein